MCTVIRPKRGGVRKQRKIEVICNRRPYRFYHTPPRPPSTLHIVQQSDFDSTNKTTTRTEDNSKRQVTHKESTYDPVYNNEQESIVEIEPSLQNIDNTHSQFTNHNDTHDPTRDVICHHESIDIRVAENDISLKHTDPQIKLPTNKRNIANENHSLKIININCQCIRNKRSALLNLAESVKPDIIIGTESWLDENIRDNEVIPPEYKMFRNDRNIHGGGVFLAIKEGLISSPVPELNEDCEILWRKIEVNGYKTVYVCAYYRPDKSDEVSLDFFIKSINKTRAIQNGIIIIGGDFNFPGWDWKLKSLKPNTSYVKLHNLFMNALDDNALTQIVEEPTRLDNTLDLIITNHPGLVKENDIIPGISDHDVPYLEIDVSPKRIKQKPRCIPLYKKADWDGLRSKIDTVAEEIENSLSLSVEDLWTQFKTTLEKGVKEHIPHKICSKKNGQPWINGTIKRMIKRRDRFYKKHKKSGDRKWREKYRQMKHHIQNEIRRQYWQYMEDMFSPEEDGNPYKGMKRFWSYVKHTKSDSNTIPPIKKGEETYTTAYDRATVLNEQFQSVFSKKQPLSLKQISENCIRENQTHAYNDQPVITELNIKTEGIEKLLKGLNPSKACGPDQINTRVLKELADSIAPCLRVIFQKSLDTGQIPMDWKRANVVPIYKKGQRNIASNYRPVSLTCVISKILEHIIVSHLMKYADCNNLLYDLQHGFRYQRSCETQLISFIDDTTKYLEKGQQIDVLIMDFSKAFDKVDHDLLCYKLRSYGINGKVNQWIQSFLTGRTQTVVVDGESSHPVSVKSGVPQGSVLGPSLFLFYINDLAERLTSTVRLFADDTIVYLAIRSQADAHILQEDLNKLANWEIKNRMEFHPEKCNVMSITRKRQPMMHNYYLHNHILDHVTSAKYLGVIIQSDLRWNEHISSIIAKANNTLGFLRRNIKIKSSKVKEKAYKSLVQPLLEYASTVWDPYNKGQINQIEMVQRRGARFVTGRYGQTDSVSAMLKELDWNSLQTRRQQQRLTMLYKIKNSLIAIPKKDISAPTRTSRRAHTNSIIPLSTTTSYRQHSFFPRTILDWNRLPTEITSSPTLDIFTQRLRHYYF